jgi:DNA-binding NarL/FixJ family response regulator
MAQSQKIRVIIAEDHPLMRLGVSAIVSAQPDMEMIAEAGSGKEMVSLFLKHRPDVNIIDLVLPEMSGVATIRAIRAIKSDAKFVVLTTYEGDEDIYQALAAGAQAYVIKGMPHNVLVDAVRRVHQGTRFLPRSIVHALDSRGREFNLSAREYQVLSLMAAGHSNREIGAALGVTEAAVKYHVSEILARLEVNDRTQAVLAAIRRGFVHL